ncbi:MAG: tRNA pseudouridine(55) synthase TruB [Candidatus Pacebacteria bacterium]|nr:tRNA pseudouridine(55) synthase TruB [Candidatus Paceibacterota bacterium]
MKDIILIDKPKGITSFDCIRILRKKLGIRKMGHAGTLDPLATGLMIIGIGPGTKKLNEYLKLDKTYGTTVLVGVSTDTGDIDGKVLKEEVFDLDDKGIKEALDKLVGKNILSVPKYSAIKKNGKPLYYYARNDIDVEIPEKEMEVYDIRDVSYYKPYIKFTVDVSSGTYIRSLVEELGKKLKVPLTLSDLRRTKIGEFDIKNSKDHLLGDL